MSWQEGWLESNWWAMMVQVMQYNHNVQKADLYYKGAPSFKLSSLALIKPPKSKTNWCKYII